MSYFDLDRTEIGCSLAGDLIVVVPIYNEMVNIRLVVTEWRTALTNLGIKFQLLLINDGLTDGTLAELQASEKESPDCICVIHKLNTGHGPTIRLGYEIACASPAEWVLQIDSDGQCDPRFFSNLWQRRQDCECVIAVRRSRNDGTARIITSWICRTGSSLITGVNLQDPNVPYRLMKREVLSAAIKRIPRNFNIHNVALTYVLRKNPAVRFSYVLVHFLDRQGGSNSINVLRVSQWGFDMLLELARIKV
jgi:glycosyltransferase involved in cell wall biosynthesis